MAKAEETVESYKKVKALQSQELSKQGSYSQPSWKPPPEGWLKMNVDAIVKLKDQYVGFRIAISNHKGEFVAASVKKSRFYGSVAYAESEAID